MEGNISVHVNFMSTQLVSANTFLVDKTAPYIKEVIRQIITKLYKYDLLLFEGLIQT